MTDFAKVTLADVLADGGTVKTGPFGTVLKAAEYAGAGVPIISVGEVDYGSLRLRKDTPHAPVEVTERLPEYVLRAGDIVFGRKGAVDRSAWVKSSEDGWFLGSDGIRLRLPFDVNTRFFAYQFQNPTVREWLLQHASGSTMLSLNQRILERVPLVVPAREVQDAIAEVLGALDDKIAANTKLAETTGQLARFVYMSMLSGATEKPLSTTADFVNGKAFTKGASGTGRVVVRIAELNSGIGGSTVYSDAEVDDKHVARAGDLLFAWSGSLTLHRWYRDDAIINQHIFKVIPRDGYPLWLVDQLLQSKIEHFKAVAADKATTMGHIQRRHLDEPVLVPSQVAIEANSVLMDGLWNLGLLAERENEKLADTRNALLPQLMSGQLRVSDL